MKKKSNTSSRSSKGKTSPSLPPGRKKAEKRKEASSKKAFWQNDKLFRALIENSSDAVSLLDSQGKILYRSPSAAMISGFSDEKILSMNMFDRVWPEDLKSARQIFAEMLKFPGKKVPFLLRVTGKDGHPRWMNGIGVNRLAEPEVQALVLHYRDFTEQKLSANALENSEKRYRNLFEHARLAIFQSTPDGKVLRVNTEFARMFGYLSPEDVFESVKDVAKDLYVDSSRREEIIRLWKKDPSLSLFENLYRRKDGSTFWGRVYLRSATDSQGTISYFEGFIEDITKNRSMDEALRESEEKFRSLFQNSPAGVTLTGLDGRYLAVNPAFCEIFGYSAEELLAVNFFDITHPEDVERSREALRVLLKGKEKNIRFNKRYIHKDGHTIWAEVNTALVYGADGKPSHFVTHVIDITKRKQAEEALAESERRYKAVSELTSDYIFRVEVRGKGNWILGFASQRFQAETGRTMDEVITVDQWRKIIHPDDMTRLLQFGKTVEAGQSGNLEVRSFRKDGGLRWVSISARPEWDERREKVVAVVGGVKDITDRKQAEKNLRESEEKYRLLFDLSPDSIALYQEGKIIFANPATAHLLGAGLPQELIGRTMLDFVHPDYRQLVMDRSRQQEREGRPVPVVEEKFVRQDGSVVDVDVTAAPIQYRGKTAHLVISRDISDRKQAGEKLRYQASLLENVNDAIVASDSQYRLTAWNTAAERLYGWKAEEVLGKSGLEITRTEWPAATAEEMRRIIAEQGHWRGEAIQIRKDGTRIPVEVSSMVLRDSSGQITGYISINRDITERKQAGEALRESEEKYRSLFENSLEGIGLSKGNRIIDANKAILDIFGYENLEELTAKPLLDHVAPESQGLIRGLLEKVRKGEPYEKRFTYKIVRKTGEIRDVEISVEHVKLGSDIYTQSTFRDVTDRIRTEKSLREQEERFRATFENANVGVCIVGLDGRLLQVNRQMCAIFGYTREELEQMTVNTIAHPEDANLSPTFIQQAVSGETDQTGFDKRYIHKDGHVLWGHVSSSLVRDPQGNPLYFISHVQDITDRKRAEESLARQTEELRQRNLELTHLTDLTERRMQHLAAMRTVDMAISSSFKSELVMNILLEQLTSQLNVHAADILIFHPAMQGFRFFCGRGFYSNPSSADYLRLADSYPGRATQERRMLKVPRLDEKADGQKIFPRISKEGFISYICVPLIAKGQIKGVMEIFHRAALELSPEEDSFLEMLAGQAAIAIDNVEMFEHLQSSRDELQLAFNSTLGSWARALELRSREGEGETQRGADLAMRLAQMMGESENDVTQIYRGAVLHDVGMIAVPDGILLKPGPLTDEEWTIVRRHPQIAFDILSPVLFLRPALDVPHCHHERWDGSGYPRGLKGEHIPLSGRIFAVADIWEALRSDRPYRKAWKESDASEYIRNQAGKHFDPAVVQAFFRSVAGR